MERCPNTALTHPLLAQSVYLYTHVIARWMVEWLWAKHSPEPRRSQPWENVQAIYRSITKNGIRGKNQCQNIFRFEEKEKVIVVAIIVKTHT